MTLEEFREATTPQEYSERGVHLGGTRSTVKSVLITAAHNVYQEMLANKYSSNSYNLPLIIRFSYRLEQVQSLHYKSAVTQLLRSVLETSNWCVLQNIYF
jgi:hypothetical protein